MAWITEVTIVGLAGRSGARTYAFDRSVNVFWGANGSGKTSLLRIIHAALNDETTGLERVPFERARVVVQSEVSRQTITRSIDMTEEPEQHDRYEIDDEGSVVLVEEAGLHWMTETSSPRRGAPTPSRLRHSYLPISRVAEARPRSNRLSAMASASRRESMNDAYFDAVFAEQVRLRWLAYSSEANAAIRDVQQQGLAEVVSLLFGGAAGFKTSPPRILADEKEAYALVVQFLRRQNIRLRIDESDFKNRYSAENDLPLVVSRIREILLDIEAALAPQRRLAELLGSLYSEGKSVDLSGSGVEVNWNDATIPLESLSSGEKQLLQIFLEVLAAGSAPVIIDEPELSMHVDWQQRLVDDMTVINPAAQLILATHSPEIGAEMSERNVHEI